ncbi:hypothetical protein GJAV_G00267650 [Gymnothorax javanicus]|nr:hypothetical protein GJAV_G00267650 [Gymnothorax javanicus]
MVGHRNRSFAFLPRKEERADAVLAFCFGSTCKRVTLNVNRGSALLFWTQKSSRTPPNPSEGLHSRSCGALFTFTSALRRPF